MVKKICRKVSFKLKIYNMITIEEFKKKYTNKVRLLGLDLGSKKIGVSISDENQSTPLEEYWYKSKYNYQEIKGDFYFWSWRSRFSSRYCWYFW